MIVERAKIGEDKFRGIEVFLTGRKLFSTLDEL
jgi:hypothetical protein